MSNARRRRSAVPSKLWALTLLLLAVSPFTAPFQTCDFADAAAGPADAVIMPLSSSSTLIANDAAPLLGPLTTETGRLKLALMAEFTDSIVGVPASDLSSRLVVASTRSTISFPIPPTILRV